MDDAEQTLLEMPELLGAAAAISETPMWRELQTAVTFLLDDAATRPETNRTLRALRFMLLGTAARIKDKLEELV